MLTALYDACVLYPAPLRDFLVRMALTSSFRARWTNQIHEEWIRNLLANRDDLTRAQLERTRDLMNGAVREALVEGYEPLIDTLTLPDADDHHVLAAAIAGEASVIVTFNLKDFPDAVLSPYGIEAQHPDEFVSAILDHKSEAVCEAVRRQRLGLRNPPQSVDELLATLEAQGLTKTVARLRSFTDYL